MASPSFWRRGLLQDYVRYGTMPCGEERRPSVMHIWECQRSCVAQRAKPSISGITAEDAVEGERLRLAQAAARIQQEFLRLAMGI